MSKRFLIISTYPEHGSKNIGDYLITASLIRAIHYVKGHTVQLETVWRESDWSNVADLIKQSDFIFFACLAIRPFMHSREYPFLEKILKLGIPYAVVAAGTDLNVSSIEKLEDEKFSDKSIELLREMDRNAVFFTTRGYLSQTFCRRLGLTNTRFSGDIAFFDPRYFDQAFEINRPIRRIAISDPHKPKLFLKSLNLVHEGIRSLFPDAAIALYQHGASNALSGFIREKQLDHRRIYEDKENGLDHYSDIDLHIGFRVHAHVSALSRRKYSYLLEQDGRGCDYGLTLDRKISVPAYPAIKYGIDLSRIFGAQSGWRFFKIKEAPSLSADLLLSIVANDFEQGFRKFSGLEQRLQEYTDLLASAIAEVQ